MNIPETFCRMNIRKLTVRLVFVFLFGMGCMSAIHAEESREISRLAPPENAAEISRAFIRRLPEAHLSQTAPDARISALAWTNYLMVLDFDRSYFLRSDLDRFEKYKTSLADDLREGRMDFAFDAFNVFRRRLDERYAFVTNQLARGFDFDREETYRWRRKDLPWPETPREQDDLWRRRIKNEYLGFMISRELDEAEAEDEDDVPGEEPPDAAESEYDLEDMTDLTPENFVKRRYEQYRIVIQDSREDWVVQRYLSAVASAYDPHSAYMSPERLEDFNIEMKLSLVGIGAMLRSEDGAALVVSIIPGGPADRDKREKRLQPGDKIIGVGQGDGKIEDVLHLPLNKIVRKIRGERGTKVVLLVIPASDPSGASTKIVDLKRDEVKLEEQAAAANYETRPLPDRGEGTLGILRLPSFYASMQNRDVNSEGFRSATYDVARLLAEMNDAEVAGVLLDLRNNGGGSLREAIDMTGLFIPVGPVVQVREPRAIHVLRDRDPAVACRLPLVVLVNRLSASASEIVSGALQDYGRAVIVGDSSTHGKGTVQTIFPLGNDRNLGSIKVTTATYYRISGASTQLRGVVPDIVIPSPYEYIGLGESSLPNAMPWTSIAATSFEPLADLAPLKPRFREASERRRNENERFQKYFELVEHVRAINQRKEMPLKYAARKELAQAEREIKRREKAVAEGVDNSESVRDDPVLNEALNILADLVVADVPMERLHTVPDARMELMRDMIRRVFGP